MKNKELHDIKTLPKWAQNSIRKLQYDVKLLRTLENMHNILSDPKRDWFRLCPPKGCTDDELGLWILNNNNPLRVCTLYKGDEMFIGRATKERHNTSLITLTEYVQTLNPKSKEWVLIDKTHGLILEHSPIKFEDIPEVKT